MSEFLSLPISQGEFKQARGCKDIAVLLPARDEAVRWEERDRPNLEKEIIEAFKKKEIIEAFKEKEIIEAFKEAATIRYFNANGDAVRQQEQADLALEKGSCILVLGPSDSEKAGEIVKKAKAQGVPTIAYDRLIQSEDLAFYVTFDSFEVGKLQGEYIVDQFEKGLDGDYDLRSGDQLVIINGDKNDNNAVELRNGAISQLQPLIDENKLDLIYDEFTPDWKLDGQAKKRVKELIQNQIRIKVISVANDAMAKVIINMLNKEYPAELGKILITGQDAETENIKHIVWGYQSMTVYKPSVDAAAKTAEVVKAFSEGTNIELLKNATTETKTGKEIPAYVGKPIGVDYANIKETVVKDGAISIEALCKKPDAKHFDEVCN